MSKATIARLFVFGILMIAVVVLFIGPAPHSEPAVSTNNVDLKSVIENGKKCVEFHDSGRYQEAVMACTRAIDEIEKGGTPPEGSKLREFLAYMYLYRGMSRLKLIELELDAGQSSA